MLSPLGRRGLALQGFAGLPDSVLHAIQPWLRWSPAVCMVWVAIGTFFGSAEILAALLPLQIVSVVRAAHPFDLLYNRAIRRLTRTPSLPPYPAPRRFADAVAAAWIAVAALAFLAHMRTLGVVLGGTFVASTAFYVATGFCLPSWSRFHAVGRPRRYRL